MEIDEQKHARAAQNIVRTHPSFFKLTWRLQNSPGITTSGHPDRNKSRFRLYIVPSKRLGRVNSGESLHVKNSVLPNLVPRARDLQWKNRELWDNP